MKKQKAVSIKQQNKITLKEFVWNGFNAIFGIAFMNYFAVIITGDGSTKGLGLHVIWVFALAALIAYICVFAYKKLASRFASDKNGGAMIYAYGAKGKLFGCFVGYSQLLILPLMAVVQMNMLIKNIFSPDIVSDPSKIPFNVQDWGAFTNLYLDLIGMFLYCSIMLITVLGIKYFRKASKWSGIIKWVTGGAFILLAFCLMFTRGSKNIPDWAGNSHLDLYNFTQAFNTSFYALVGFETIITAGKNIENPKKNLGKGVNLAMLFSIGTSILFFIILFCAFGSFSENQDISGWTSVFGSTIWAKIGIVLTCCGIIMMYSNGAIQNGLYSGTSLQPLSEVGFFSKRTGALNKDNVPVRAIITMVCICLALAVVLLVIPETIEGFDLQGKMTGDRTQDIIIISEYVPPFSVASLSQVTSIYAIITYISVVFTVLYCILKEKSIKSNIYLNVAFFICLFFLAVFAVCHLFFEIYDVIASRGQMSFVIKIVSELTVLIATYGFFAANYYVKCKQISNNY